MVGDTAEPVLLQPLGQVDLLLLPARAPRDLRRIVPHQHINLLMAIVPLAWVRMAGRGRPVKGADHTRQRVAPRLITRARLGEERVLEESVVDAMLAGCK